MEYSKNVRSLYVNGTRARELAESVLACSDLLAPRSGLSKACYIDMEWSQEKCVLMIEAYRSHKCLWDPNSKHYKNTLRKQYAWEKIADILKCTVEEAKKKMDSLLASYRRERQKTMTKKSGSGTDYSYNSKWFAFKSMHFLMDKYKPRKRFVYNINQNKNLVNEQETEVNEEERAAVVDANGDTQPGSTTHPEPVESVQSTIISRKRFKLEDPRGDKARIIEDTYGSKIRLDTSQAFGNHVASKHREYSKRTRAYVEYHINNILFEADLGKFDIEPSLASTQMSSHSESSQNRVLSSVLTDLPPNQVTTVLEDSSQVAVQVSDDN